MWHARHHWPIAPKYLPGEVSLTISRRGWQHTCLGYHPVWTLSFSSPSSPSILRLVFSPSFLPFPPLFCYTSFFFTPKIHSFKTLSAVGVLSFTLRLIHLKRAVARLKLWKTIRYNWWNTAGAYDLISNFETVYVITNISCVKKIFSWFVGENNGKKIKV